MTKRTSRSIPGRVFITTGTVVSTLIGTVGHAAASVYGYAENWMLDAKRATYGLAVARILLGVTVLGMTLTNFSTRFYTFGAGAAWTGELEYPSSDFAQLWPFSIMSQSATNDGVFTALYLALIVCAVLFTIGYRTRLVMIPMFVLWVGFVEINTYVNDQSDNLTRIAMIALFLTAPSDRWSLDARRRAKFEGKPGSLIPRLWRFQPVLPSWIPTLLQNCGVVVLAAQLCFIYAAGGLFKAQGLPWFGGTAIYAPIHTQQFGTWPELSAIVTAWGPMVAIATITSVLIQVSFPLLLLRRGTRIFALVVILGFHVGIGILMGLPWFSLAMVALDSIFIRDRTWLGAHRAIQGAWRNSRPGRRRGSPLPAA